MPSPGVPSSSSAAIEMGVGGWAKAAHQLPLDQLLREPGERNRLAGELSENGLTLSCVNAAGNPLHPDPAVGPRHAALLRGAVELAGLLGVDRVVTMSGCPGGRDGGPSPVFAPWALTPDDESLWNWQYEQRLAPFWKELGAWARTAAPAVLICLELHAGRVRLQPRRLSADRRRPAATTCASTSIPATSGGRASTRCGCSTRSAIGSRSATARTRCFTPTGSPTMACSTTASRSIRTPLPGTSPRSAAAVGWTSGRGCWLLCAQPDTTVTSRSSTRTRGSTPNRASASHTRCCGPRWRRSVV